MLPNRTENGNIFWAMSGAFSAAISTIKPIGTLSLFADRRKSSIISSKNTTAIIARNIPATLRKKCLAKYTDKVVESLKEVIPLFN
jgi:hypothetical protein